MIRGALLLAVVGGCQMVLGLDRLPDAHDAGSGSDWAMCATSGHDEDCDGVPDAIDDCPGVADDQTDTDGDGVGDACDPQPGKQDSLAAFYAFDSANDLAQLAPYAGHWFVQDDALVNDDTTSDQEDGVVEGVTRARPLAIETEVTVDDIGQDGTYKVGLVYYTSPQDSDEVSCAIIRAHGSGNAPLDVVEAYVVGTSATQPLAGSRLGDGARYQIREVMNAAGLRCEVTGAAGDGATVSNARTEPAAPQNAGMYTLDTGVHYHYVAIYALGS